MRLFIEFFDNSTLPSNCNMAIAGKSNIKPLNISIYFNELSMYRGLHNLSTIRDQTHVFLLEINIFSLN